MDLFAEDEDNRTIIEIQKVDYDYSYDRFAHYFLANLIDMQRSSRDYSFEKEVYVIVVVTSAYRISDVDGKPIKDDVLITDIHPRNIDGKIRKMTNHEMIILNTTYVNEQTPKDIKDWMDLITESMKHPRNPKINTAKPAIVKAAKLAEKDQLTPEQLADAKEMEMRKATIALVEDMAREQAILEKKESIKKALEGKLLSKENICKIFNVTMEYVNLIEEEID